MRSSTTLFALAAAALAVFSVALGAQATVPTLPYDAVDFLRPPANMPIGEVAGVATNSKGHVFIYERSGTFNTTLGTARTFPHGASRLLEFDRDGKFVREIGRDVYAFAYAQSVKIDPQDNVWIVDQYSNMAVKFDPEGRVLMTFGRRPETSRIPNPPTAAAAAPAGGAPGRGGAGRGAGAAAPAARGGRGAVAGDSFNRPTDVAWDAAGNIFIADGFGNSRVLKMDKNGRFLKTFGTPGSEAGQFNMLASLATDAQGNLYVADKGNNRIQVFDNDGNFKKQFTNVGAPAAICISPGAHQYLYSSNSNDPDDLEHGEIYKMELDGAILGKFGTAGHMVREFGSVNSIDCRTENTLYVGELINWRVQKVMLKNQ
ncbi:MAG TPA: peptidyl-alpha-hydroxyglycine alpha-amidating lyase family protein [Terriglobia bacterium]|nr:peptidyl-alpha-hydroxyglycine alpha-amidating lyase family protein [Terriglobia bacterium]